MSDGIVVQESPPEQVLVGEHSGVRLVVLSVKADEASAEICWKAACDLLDTLSAANAMGSSSALIVDIATASVRHGYITEMGE